MHFTTLVQWVVIKYFGQFAMLSKQQKIIIRCLAIVPIIYILDVFGAFIHIFEKDFEEHFYYPVESQHNNVAGHSNEAFNYNIIQQAKISMDLSSNTPRLTILIKSATDNRQQRNAIRKTWGYEKRFSDVHIKRVFLLGLPQTKSVMMLINEESKQFNDIVQGNFLDNYFNNTLKTMTGIRWASEYFNHSDYYFFVDDDYYVSIKNLLRFIGHGSGKTQQVNAILQNKSKQNNLLFAGYVLQTAPLRHRFSKWYVSLKEYPFDKWPPYVTAGAFILSRDALLRMQAISRRLPLFRFDDIYLAIVALKAGIKTQHCANFYFNRPRYKGPESYSSVVASHGFSDPMEMETIWNECHSANYA